MDEEAPAERAHLPAVRLEQRLLGEQEAVVAAHGLRFLPEDDIGRSSFRAMVFAFSNVSGYS